MLKSHSDPDIPGNRLCELRWKSSWITVLAKDARDNRLGIPYEDKDVVVRLTDLIDSSIKSCPVLGLEELSFCQECLCR